MLHLQAFKLLTLKLSHPFLPHVPLPSLPLIFSIVFNFSFGYFLSLAGTEDWPLLSLPEADHLLYCLGIPRNRETQRDGRLELHRLIAQLRHHYLHCSSVPTRLRGGLLSDNCFLISGNVFELCFEVWVFFCVGKGQCCSWVRSLKRRVSR